MASKTVAAVVSLIDQFSAPSKQVIKQSRDMEKRFENTAKVFRNVGAVFENTGKTLAKSVTAPLAAVGTASVKFASESQDAFQQFAASTGTTADSMEKYKDMINDVYKDNFGESINEVADAMATVDKNMSYLDDSALKRCTEYAFTLADTFGVDVAESTRAADTLIKNYGIEAREAFNLMSQGMQQGLDFSGELFDNIDEYSVQFKKLGLDANDMFSIFASGAENGAFNLDKVGDAVKEFSIRAIDGSDTTIAGFNAIGLNATEMAKQFAAGGDGAKAAFEQVIQGLANMEDPVEQSIAGVNLFGTMWEDLGPQVITSLSTTNDAIDMTRESMEALVNTKYDTLQSAMGGLWRAIQVDVLQPIGNMLIPYVTKAIDKVKVFTSWWNNLGEGTQKTVVKFAMVAAAVGPILIGFGKVSSGIGGLIENYSKLSGGIAKLTNGFSGFSGVLTGPVGVAIAAVAAGAVLVYQNWDKIGPIVTGIGERFQELWNTVEPIIQPLLDQLGKVAEFVETVFKASFDVALAGIGEGLVSLFNSADEVIGNLLGLLEGIISFFEGVFTGNWEKAWNGLRDIVSNSFGALEGLIKIPLNAAIGVINGAVEKINSIHFTVPEWVPGIGGKGWEGLNIPAIPALASGTMSWQGGLAQVHEKGGEIIDLPKGSRVYPHDESVQMARKEGMKKSLSVTIAKLADQIIVREDADIEKIANTIIRKLEETDLNMA